MFNLMVSMNNRTNWLFMFRKIEDAEKIMAKYIDESVDQFIYVSDDFGSRGVISRPGIAGILIESLDKGSEAAVERMMCQARNQAKAQSRANNDPAMRAMMAMQGGLNGAFPRMS